MSGKPKQGIDFAGWSVNIFDGDTKIDKLLEAQGWQGFSIYFYLCQMAYKFDGYFYKWSYDDSTTTARRMGGGIRSETVKATVNTCFRVGLFHKGLFEEHGILTSKGIQRRYYAVIRSRRARTVNADFWLLDAEECTGLRLLPANADSQAANADSQPANADLQAANAIESKVKKSKVEIHTAPTVLSAAREKAAGGTIGPYPAKARELYAYFEENCNVFNARHVLNAITRCLLDGIMPDVLTAVIDETALSGANSPARYAVKIMDNILAEQVRDLSAYQARSARFKKQKEQNANGTDCKNHGSDTGEEFLGGKRY